MRMVASDLISYWRPKPCDLRIFLRQMGEKESEPSAFDEVLRKLGIQHERAHLASLGAHLDISKLQFEQRVERTLEAIAKQTPVIYQPSFEARLALFGTDVEVFGEPDFLIFGGDGYVIRDSKMSRHIDFDNHPEIIFQVQLYGWLFERTVGSRPKALQVYSGMKDIVDIANDGGAGALAVLQKLIQLKQLAVEPYEPVGWSKCNPCGFFERCWSKAEKSSDVALIPDVDQSTARALRAEGISSRKELLSRFDVASLGEFKRPFGKSERKVGKAAERIIQFANAMEKNEEQILGAPEIPLSANYVMFDLEGMPPHLDEMDKIYLWGMQVFGERPSEFMAAVSGFGPEGDKEGWRAFLGNAKQIFEACGDVPFVHWAPYEKTKLNMYVARHGDVNGIAARVAVNLLDLLTVARNSVVLPLPSFSLKVVEKHVGFRRAQHEYGGDWAMAKFIEATETSDVNERQKLMAEILKYNQEDLEATWAVFECLRKKTLTAGSAYQ